MTPSMRAIGLGAVATIAAIAIAAFAVGCDNDDPEPVANAPETAAEATPTENAADVPAATDEGCMIAVDSVTFALDPRVSLAFMSQGLDFTTISPAKTITTGQLIAPRIHAARDVTCDLSDGYVGMRGGFSVANERARVEFRRFRLSIDEREMLAFLKSTGNAGLAAIEVDVDEAQFTEQGSLISAVVPMTLDSGAAVAMNAALGTDFPADEIELGTVTISGSRSDSDVATS